MVGADSLQFYGFISRVAPPTPYYLKGQGEGAFLIEFAKADAMAGSPPTRKARPTPTIRQQAALLLYGGPPTILMGLMPPYNSMGSHPDEDYAITYRMVGTGMLPHII
jgi:hypothetical protein